jgi:putative endonuclease
MDRCYWVYIMSSKRGTIYTGVTGNLRRRVWQHKIGRGAFTSRYNCHRLVFAEWFDDPLEAIAREKQIKGWLRRKKVALIEDQNPTWADLAADWFSEEGIEEGRRLVAEQRQERDIGR